MEHAGTMDGENPTYCPFCGYDLLLFLNIHAPLAPARTPSGAVSVQAIAPV